LKNSNLEPGNSWRGIEDIKGAAPRIGKKRKDPWQKKIFGLGEEGMQGKVIYCGGTKGKKESTAGKGRQRAKN